MAKGWIKFKKDSWRKSFPKRNSFSHNEIMLSKRTRGLKGYWYVRRVNSFLAERHTFDSRNEAVKHAMKEMRRLNK